jgi:UPF0042 nucleotide-binding protein
MIERFVVLTGLSGAGKTTGLHALEDLGFFTADNVPPSLWARLISQAERAGHRQLVVGIDVRTRNFLADVEPILEGLRREGIVPEVIFLDATDDVLVKRYNLTRRTHPLGHAPLSNDIAQEREVLGPLRALADIVLDTSRLSARNLTEQLWQRFGHDHKFRLRIMSFGFKRGVPIDADNVFDVRALPNPFYNPELRKIDGRDKRVQSYIFTPATLEFYSEMREFVRRLTQMAQETGRSSYTIAIGCTGGQHRSVALAERLAYDLTESFATTAEHRDVELALREHEEETHA